MENTVETLGEKISRLRDARGWSQEKLAEESEVARRTIQNIEGSKVESPGIDVVLALAGALGVSIGFLVEGKATRAELILDIQTSLAALNEDELRAVAGFIDSLGDRLPSRPGSSSAEGL